MTLAHSTSRRSIIKKLAAGATAQFARAAGSKPNVVFIISDQFHYAAYGAAGNPVAKTPDLDRLAGEGVRFERAVCVTPFCSPSRASFMTGLYPHKHRITYNVDLDRPGLDPKLPSTEQILFDAGYTCRQFGKWHLGDRKTLPPYADEPDGNYSEGPRKVRPQPTSAIGRGARSIEMIDAVKNALAKWPGNPLPGSAIGKIDVRPEDYAESRFTTMAIRELDQLAGKPFFLTLSMSAPHAPFQVGDPFYSMFDRAAMPLPANRNSVEPIDRKSNAWRYGQLLGDEGLREYLAVRYALIAMVDWNVGRLLDALRKKQLDQDTLVVFTSDHGDMQAGHGMYDKSVFSLYEEITRVPLIVKFPGRIPAGKTVRTQAGTCDIHPTILDYMSMKARGAVHGSSLRPYIDGHEDLSRPIFCERERGERGFQRMIRTAEWKYVYSTDGSSQLYNLTDDGGETRNLVHEASARPALQRLHAQLGDWMRQTADSRNLPTLEKRP